jgi:hypothetical protein
MLPERTILLAKLCLVLVYVMFCPILLAFRKASVKVSGGARGVTVGR